MMKNISISKGLLALAIPIATVATVAIVANHKQQTVLLTKHSPEVVKLDVDHKQYGDIDTLQRDADVVVRATVLNSGDTTQGLPVGISPDGRVIPSVPQTNFAVKVDKVLRGSVTTGQITVSLTG